MALFLMLGASFISSCNDDDDSTPISEESTLIGYYAGFTTGSSTHFQNLKMPNVTDTVIVAASAKNNTNFDITYKSAYWGTALFENVQLVKSSNANAWEVKASTEGTIKMPYRNPAATEVTYKDYQATLASGTISSTATKGTNWERAQFTIEANLGERAGIYTLVFDTKE